MADAPFQMELHLGGGTIVAFEIAEEDITEHRHPRIKAAADGTREGFRRGAVTIVNAMLDKNDKTPIEVIDHDGAFWIIPTRNVLAARFLDTTLAKGQTPVGFSLGNLVPTER